MRLPDRVFAVGGAGKEIAFTLLESDWVIEDVLHPRPNPQSLTVSILDTAIGERNSDRNRIQEIRTRISEVKDELRDESSNRVGDIEIEYKLITEDIQLSGSIDLLGDDAVPRIAAGNGMNEEDWWLEEQHINENLDFARGVVRKRGLGKAIYYKSYAEDDQMKTFIDLPEKGRVAILIGLGGGTGSGVLADLASEIQSRQRTAEITLFGVLPNHTEGIKENTNAFAALSELEYLSLTDQNLFKDCILLPIDPTGFDGKTGNRIQTGELLNELDEAIVYLLASYYNTQNLEDPFASSPSYAPFTIGIPQILRYNVEAITEGRDALREILDRKETSMQAEEELYTAIGRFLAKHYDEVAEDETGLRDLDETDLTERIEKVEELLAFELFHELEYESVSVFSEIVSDARNEGDGISEQIDIMLGSIRAVDTSSGSFVDNIDEHLAEILETDLQLIARRKSLFEQRKAVDDNRIRDTIEYLLGAGSGNVNPGVKMQRLEAELEEVEEKQGRLGEELTETNAELERLRTEQAEEIDRNVNNLLREIEPTLETLSELQQLSLESELTGLETALDEYRTSIVNADTPEEVENVSAGSLEQVLDEIERQLDRIGVDFQQDRQDIQSSLADLRKARIAFLEMHQETTLWERLTPWTSSTEETREQAHKDYRMQKSKLDNRGVFSLGTPSTFDAEITFSPEYLLSEVGDRRSTLESEILGEFQEHLEELTVDIEDDLRAELRHGADSGAIREIAHRAFRREIEGTESVEQRKDELETELDETETKRQIYQDTIDLFQNINHRRDAFAENLEAFYTARADYDEDSSRTVSTADDDYVYVKNVRPMDVFRATGSADIAASELLKNRGERQRLRTHLEELAGNARNEQYTGLARRKFSKGRSRYDDLKVRVAVLSRAIEQMEPDTLEFEDIFSGAFDLGASGKRVESPYTSWQRDVGGPWDIGLTVFIDGVFLDNLRKMVQAEGYASGYQRRRETLGDDILIHHSYGLEQGMYVRRADLLNIESERDVEFFLRDDRTIAEELLEDYIERVQVSAGEQAREGPTAPSQQTDDSE